MRNTCKNRRASSSRPCGHSRWNVTAFDEATGWKGAFAERFKAEGATSSQSSCTPQLTLLARRQQAPAVPKEPEAHLVSYQYGPLVQRVRPGNILHTDACTGCPPAELSHIRRRCNIEQPSACTFCPYGACAYHLRRCHASAAPSPSAFAHAASMHAAQGPWLGWLAPRASGGSTASARLPTTVLWSTRLLKPAAVRLYVASAAGSCWRALPRLRH